MKWEQIWIEDETKMEKNMEMYRKWNWYEVGINCYRYEIKMMWKSKYMKMRWNEDQGGQKLHEYEMKKKCKWNKNGMKTKRKI